MARSPPIDFKLLIVVGGLFILSSVLTVYNVPLALSQEAVLQSKRIVGAVPLSDPNATAWTKALPVEVPLSAQTTAFPMLLAPSIKSVTVRAIHNGTWIAFLLEWRDTTRNTSTSRTEDFRDAAAIQFPLSATQPFVCMGQLGNTVNVWHWKGDWQEDIETTFRDVIDTYPNFFVDYYPHAVGGPPYSTVPPANVSRAFIAGWAAGNPLSDPFKLTPIEDLVAGGFGTLTSQPHQDTVGRGVWSRGTWQVVFARPLVTVDENDARFSPGKKKPIAFAVWDGGNREVDGRKSVSSWLVLDVEAPPPSEVGVSLSFYQTVALAGIFILSIAILLLTAKISDRTAKSRTARPPVK